MDAEKLNVGDIENDRNMLNKCDTHSKIGVESDKVEEPEQVNIDISCKTDNIVISQNNVPSNNENILLIHQSNLSITANNNNIGVGEMSAITDCDGSAYTKNIVITNIDKEEFMNSHGIEKDNINNNLCNTKPIENLISYNNDITSCIDKDSDDESVTCDRKINRRIKNVIDSDEECNDNMNNKNHESVDTKATICQRKKLNVIDSDSEEEEVLPSKEVPIYSVDIKGNLIQENNHSRLLAICDPDTDEDESTYIEERSFSENTSLETSKKSGKKRKPQIDSDTRTKKFTGRDAQKLKKEIQSESQRMTRESAIHLPYHKPKARTLTLKEFLQNRSCFSAAIPISNSKRPPSLAIKMSTDQLKAISEKLREREKEVKKFFKSESESDEEENLEKSNISVQLTKNSVQEHLEDCHEKTGSASIIILQNIELVPCKDAGANNCPIDENNTPSCQPLQQLNKVETDNQVEIENSLINEIKVEEKSQNHNNNTKDQHVTINRENENYYTEEIETIKLINEDKGLNAVSEKHETDSSMQVEHKEAVDTHEQTKDDKINETNLNLKLGFEKGETQNIENDNLNKLIEKYTSSEFTNETLYDVEKNKHTSEEKSQKSILDLVKDKFSNFKPQLQGSSDEIIDLEDGSIKVNEVNQLINRFVKHTKKISPTKHKVKLDIVSLSEGEIRKETVEMSVNGEETIPINEKPGERIKKLREELQMQMAQKRSEVWQQRSDTKIRDKTMSTEVEGTDYKEEETDILDDDNEEVFTNTEDEEDEDMDEEDEDMDEDVETKPKNIFLDEEADESDIDDDEMDPEETENNENVFEKGYHLGGESETEEHQQSISNFEKHRKKKQLKRIIQPFSNESDDESTLDVHEDFKSKQEHLNLNDPEKVKEIQLDSTDTWDENCELTPHQARKSQTPLRRQTQSKSELGFLTPVVQLTGLQSLNSGSKFLHESPISPFVVPSDTSPIKPSSQSGPQKKLFADMDLTTTQDLKEVAELCSGVFPSQSQEFDSSSVKDDNTRNVSEDFNSVSAQIGVTQNLQTPSTQDLLEICSGQFTGITQIAVPRKDKQDIQTTGISEFNNNSKSSQSLTEVLIQNNEIKNLDGEDNLISEILNEEEMENFKRKFDSPVSNSPTSVSFSRIIYDSSDEETNLPIKMKNKQRKLVFSDEEDTDEDELVNECDENIELHDEYSKDDDSNVDEVKNVDYDSEENEIEWVEEDKPKKMKIADFLENEAELSESEWGSADEDERDLDELELEEGDNEKFDEQQVKRDLERIHIRRVLDDDNHEIKILQEILLDDGEMHGNGRERQFRWKNIDSIDNATDIRQDNGEVYLDEDEDEEKWRKMRYEREVFLKKQLQKSQSLDIEDDLHVKASSQIIKLGQAAIKRSISTSQNVSVVSERQIAPAKLENSSGILLNKRGSFLTRSDQVLERVAEFTKTLTTVSNTKNSKNFIFQAVSASTKTIIPNKKRKAMTDSPTAIKRLRLNNLSPLVQKIGRKGE